MRVHEQAPAKLNLVLHVGPPGQGGLHPLCSLFASVDLADEVDGTLTGAGEDTVECQGVEGQNLALTAVEEFRRRVSLPAPLPAVSIRILKRIPVAAGLGGGSADAAAALRIVNRLAGAPLDAGALRELAAALGSDVPSQVEPRHVLVQGTGESVEPVQLPPLAAVLVPDPVGLSTGDVYAELDRLGGWRERLDPKPLRRLVLAAAAEPARLASSLENDLQPAAVSLRPELHATLARLQATGALGAAVSGSGPTCFGLFSERAAAEQAVASLPGALVTAFRSMA